MRFSTEHLCSTSFHWSCFKLLFFTTLCSPKYGSKDKNHIHETESLTGVINVDDKESNTFYTLKPKDKTCSGICNKQSYRTYELSRSEFSQGCNLYCVNFWQRVFNQRLTIKLKLLWAATMSALIKERQGGFSTV